MTPPQWDGYGHWEVLQIAPGRPTSPRRRRREALRCVHPVRHRTSSTRAGSAAWDKPMYTSLAEWTNILV